CPCEPPPPTNIPTLSEWGLIAMAGILGLGIIGFMVMRRRKVAA
ncbi:MAG: IPTL-CTERM sorting domain-containing protein, partial [Candidatus Dadabacteria bacterium]